MNGLLPHLTLPNQTLPHLTIPSLPRLGLDLSRPKLRPNLAPLKSTLTLKDGGVEFGTVPPGKNSRIPDFLPGNKNYIVFFTNAPLLYGFRFLNCTILIKRKSKSKSITFLHYILSTFASN